MKNKKFKNPTPFTQEEIDEMIEMGIDPYEVEVMQEGGQIGNEEQIMQLIQLYGNMTQTDPQEIVGALQQMEPQEQEQAVSQMMQAVQQAQGGQGQMPMMQMGGLTPEEQQMMQAQQTQPQPQGGGQEEEIMQILQAYAQMNQMSEEEFNQLMTMFQNASPEEQQQMLQEIVAELEGAQGGQPQQEMSPEEAAMMEQQMAQEQQAVMKMGGYFDKLRSMQKGGMQQMYENPVNPNVEVENKEVIKTPKGEAFKVTGPTHAEGGINMSLPQNSIVFSEHLKAPKEITERFLGKMKSNKKMSFADIANKYTTDKDIKVLEDPNADKYAKATAEINLAMKNEKLNSIFEAQEMFKNAAGLDKVEYSDSSKEVAKNGLKKKEFRFL